MMTTQTMLPKPPVAEAVADKWPTYDPFKLGWREVPQLGPDGRVRYERVPLTAYDILHPKEGDFRIHNDEHKRFCVYLDNVLRAQVAHDPHAVVLHDTGVDWDVPNLEPHSPDIALIFNVREHKKWGIFKVAEEGARPLLVIEITSPETRSIDLVDKADQYEVAGLPYYVIVDAYISRRHPAYTIVGYELTPDGYVEMLLDEHGRLWLEPAHMWLGLHDNQLVCYDVHGNEIKNYVDLTSAYAEAEERAQAEAQARTQAEERLHALEAELRRLRSENPE